MSQTLDQPCLIGACVFCIVVMAEMSQVHIWILLGMERKPGREGVLAGTTNEVGQRLGSERGG